MAHFREVAVECDENVPDTAVWLTFLKSGYVIAGYIQTLRDFDSEKRFISVPVKYGRRLWRVFATDNFGSSGEKWNTFVIFSDGGEEGGRIWVAKLLPLFRLSLSWSNESHKYAFCNLRR